MNRLITLLAAISLLGLPAAGDARAESGRAKLSQYMEQLKSAPDDVDLRKKIIALLNTLKPRPATPPEARRPFVKAMTFQKEAKGSAGLERAIDSYKQALLLAPWWPEAYYNLSTAQESAGKFDDAIVSLTLYLATNPSESEAGQAQDRIYALEAKKESAAVAVPREKPEAAFLRALNGVKWECDDGTATRKEMELVGAELWRSADMPDIGPMRYKLADLSGREFTLENSQYCTTGYQSRPPELCAGKGTINFDGSVITLPMILSDQRGTYSNSSYDCRRK